MNLIHRQHKHSAIHISSFLSQRVTKIKVLLAATGYWCQVTESGLNSVLNNRPAKAVPNALNVVSY